MKYNFAMVFLYNQHVREFNLSKAPDLKKALLSSTIFHVPPVHLGNCGHSYFLQQYE